MIQTSKDRAIALFQQVEKGTLFLDASVTVIADAVFVLTSKRLYNRSHEEVAAKLTTLVRLPGFHVESRNIVLRALQLYGTNRYPDFGEAMIVAHAEQSGVRTVYSYDTDFDLAPGVTRRDP